MSLYIRTLHDPPHRQSRSRPAESVCGVRLLGAKEVTEEQALVFLGDLRCATCDPHHKYHVLKKATP